MIESIGHWVFLTKPFLLPAASCALLLVQWDLVSHEMFRRGADVGSGMVWTVVALLVSAILGGRSGIVLVNRSSLQSLYAARGCSHVPGRVEPLSTYHRRGRGRHQFTARRRPAVLTAIGRISREVLFTSSTSSPINRSIDDRGRRMHDRPGENMAVGPCGVSVGPSAHALWLNWRRRRERRRASGRRRRVAGAVRAAPRFAGMAPGRCADERHAAQRMDVDFRCGVVTERVLGHELRHEV